MGREDPLEKEMAIHSSTLAWEIPWTEEPDRLQSMGLHRRTRLSNFPFTFRVKAMTNLDRILKTRDITLLTKVCLVKAMASPVVMYGCESWTVEKAERGALMLSNCVLEKTLESLGQHGDQTYRSQRKSTLIIHWKD